jgi:GNAT superfamily N-acetyltransferase
VSVGQEDPAVAISLAYRMAAIFRQEQGYDFSGWPRRKKYWDDDGENDAHAFLMIRARKAVGIAIVRKRLEWFWWAGADPGHLYRREARRPIIERIFVCADFRRQGIARALVQAAADHYGTAATELGWQIQLTSAGAELVRAVCGNHGFYVG